MTRVGIRAPRNFVAGAALVAFCATALVALGDLETGTMMLVGPAMIPRVVATLIGLGGLVLMALGMLRDGPPLEAWRLRGPVLMTCAVLVFAATIRVPGFLVGGPLTIIVAGLSSPDNKLHELAIFAVVMTVFCILLFKVLLGQPMVILSIPNTPIRI